MKLKRRWGGHVLQREFAALGETKQKPSERMSPLGPFEIEGKDFVAITYFRKQPYRRWMLSHGAKLFLGSFSHSLYLKTTSLASKTTGMMILDNNVRLINDNDLKKRVALLALVWIDTYISPAFPPKLQNLVAETLKSHTEIIKKCKNREKPKTNAAIEKFYLEQLKKADDQIIASQPLFQRHEKLLKEANIYFNAVSDKPSETSMSHLREVMKRATVNFGELSHWCNEQAKAWPAFIDSLKMYEKSQQNKKNVLRRLGLHLVPDLLLWAIAEIVTAGNTEYALVFAVISSCGLEGVNMVRDYGWQAKALKKQAQLYQKFSKRTNNFLKIYNKELNANFFR